MSSESNPLLVPSELPYHLPPFDRIEISHFLPAFEQGMAEHRDEVERIATNPEAPTFANTLEALERSGQLLERVQLIFFNLAASDTNGDIQQLEAAVAPRLAEHSDAIFLDPRLFERVRQVYARRDHLELDEESAWLLERYYQDFVRAGAELSEADQARLRELNAELSSLRTQFSANLLADTNDSAVVVQNAAALAGLSEDDRTAARREDGSYALFLRLFTSQPELAWLQDRSLRQRLFETSIARGSRGNEHDNRALVQQLVRLRAEHAQLLGYESHAAYVIADATAGTVDNVSAMLDQLTPAAVANARQEASDLRQLLPEGETLQPWDWAYLAEQLRTRRYDVDTASLRPYFELEQVLIDGVLFAAGRLYGLRFDERFDLPTYHPDVRVFEVFESDGSPIGLFLADLYSRESKRGGAWMNSFVKQSRLLGTKPVVTVNLNIAPSAGEEPPLLTFDEVRTLFHEFGHALHGLFSDVQYPRFAATSVPRDFVEYPSQVNEMWALAPEVLENYAIHYLTGEPLPSEVRAKLHAAKQFNEGFKTTEYLAATLLDQAWHRLSVTEAQNVEDVLAFEAAALQKAGVALPEIYPRYRSTYFSHIFGGPGYSGRYYSYIWSEVLDAESVDWFERNGGLLRENGDHFRRTLLSRGGSADAMQLFRAFAGRDPRIDPLLQRRGLA